MHHGMKYYRLRGWYLRIADVSTRLESGVNFKFQPLSDYMARTKIEAARKEGFKEKIWT
jgi:hypothetical protein